MTMMTQDVATAIIEVADLPNKLLDAVATLRCIADGDDVDGDASRAVHLVARQIEQDARRLNVQIHAALGREAPDIG